MIARVPWAGPVALLALALSLAGCPDGGDHPVNWQAYDRPDPPDPVDAEVPPDAGDAGDAEIDVPMHAEVALEAIEISPALVRIGVGGNVTWQNFDPVQHDVRSGTPAAPTPLFNSGLMDRGGRFTFEFAAPGRYEYFCSTHANWMLGAIVEVVE